MVHLMAGTDTYGRVKKVKRTPVVTKFAMLHFLPVYPLQSYYFFGSGKSKGVWVPFLFSTHQATVHGIALRRLDIVSVLMAYLRAFFAVLLTFGSLCFVVGLELFSRKQLDDFQWTLLRVLFTAFVVGAAGGSLTYAVPVMSRRERLIRSFCGEGLWVGVDPARVLPDVAHRMDEESGNASLPEHVANPLLSREDCIRELISVRAWLAQGLDAGHLEQRTDELLERLSRLPAADVADHA